MKKGDWMIGKMKEGRLAGSYYHNFFNRDRILSLWKEAGFDDIQINHFIEDYEDPTMRYQYFNVIAQKE